MVVSIDPRRVYVKNQNDVKFKTIRVTNPGKETIVILSFSLLHWLFFCLCMYKLLSGWPSFMESFEFCLLLISGPNGEEYAWYQCTVSILCFLNLFLPFKVKYHIYCLFSGPEGKNN